MTTEQELAQYASASPTLLTVGVFDGVHRGHLALIDTLNREAHERGLHSGVITFEPHPQAVLHPDEPLPLLSGVEERLELLRAAGVAIVVPVTFTPEFSRRSPEEFVTMLATQLRMKGLVLGPDSGLGRDREGTATSLARLGEKLDFTVASVPPYVVGGQMVSSTAIRHALASGDIERTTLLLGRPYRLSGTVLTTSKRGASLGFPTANLPASPWRALPADGVYATIANVSERRFASVTNVGHRPTFGDKERIVETHILDFNGSLYDSVLSVDFVARLRDEVPFRDSNELVQQIGRDVDATRQILGAAI
jgi:riboflavin kinase/FMN adenylyltransferase